MRTLETLKTCSEINLMLTCMCSFVCFQMGRFVVHFPTSISKTGVCSSSFRSSLFLPNGSCGLSLVLWEQKSALRERKRSRTEGLGLSSTTETHWFLSRRDDRRDAEDWSTPILRPDRNERHDWHYFWSYRNGTNT